MQLATDTCREQISLAVHSSPFRAVKSRLRHLRELFRSPNFSSHTGLFIHRLDLVAWVNEDFD